MFGMETNGCPHRRLIFNEGIENILDKSNVPRLQFNRYLMLCDTEVMEQFLAIQSLIAQYGTERMDQNVVLLIKHLKQTEEMAALGTNTTQHYGGPVCVKTCSLEGQKRHVAIRITFGTLESSCSTSSMPNEQGGKRRLRRNRGVAKSNRMELHGISHVRPSCSYAQLCVRAGLLVPEMADSDRYYIV